MLPILSVINIVNISKCFISIVTLPHSKDPFTLANNVPRQLENSAKENYERLYKYNGYILI